MLRSPCTKDSKYYSSLLVKPDKNLLVLSLPIRNINCKVNWRKIANDFVFMLVIMLHAIVLVTFANNLVIWVLTKVETKLTQIF